MAAINSVPKSIHLPLNALSAPRVLMCHASVGTDSSVTLKLREAHGSSTESKQSNSSTSLDNVLTIGYADADMIADVLGTFQTASLKNCMNNKLANATSTTTATVTAPLPVTTTTTITTNSECNSIDNTQIQTTNKIAPTLVTSTSNTSKTNSYIKNCLIRSTSCGNNNSSSNINNNTINNNNNNNNITSLAQIMSKSPSTHHSHNSTSQTHASNTSSVSSSSNFSSNSNDSISSSSNNSNSSGSTQLRNNNNNNKIGQNVPGSTNPSKIVKKNRSKALSPTRHGPQQCQICNKIFGNASALAKHKLTHSDERKYVCSMCTKAFKRQDHLNGHMMTHRNKKPYECKADGCNKSYCDARSLRRHTENHHAGSNISHIQTINSPTPTTASGNSLITTTTNKDDVYFLDGSTSLRTYISNGSSLVEAKSGVTLTEDQFKTISLPLNTTVSLLSPASSSSSNSGGAGGGSTPSASSATTCPNITVAETQYDGEGLTPKQLDLISQIMQRTKQTSAQVTVSSPTSVNSYKIATSNASPDSSQNSIRPRTWNMQLLNQSKKISITVDEIASVELFTKNNSHNETLSNKPKTLEEELSLQSGALVHPNLLKNDLKPVECNLCHRKFKNIPALNGHMRLHGGYFKKDPEAKKNEKKESSGPPLQTASIGVRALIEEKIISKRGKDLKGSFIVPAPPGSTLNTTTNRRTVMEREGKDITHNNNQQNESSINSNNNRIATSTTIQLPSTTTILNSKTTQNVICLGTNTPSPNTSTTKTLSFFPSTTTTTIATHANSMTKSSVTELKDSTLIELLKRGTRVAVTHRKSLPNSTNIILNNDLNINCKNSNNNNNNSNANANANNNNNNKDFELTKSLSNNNTTQIITTNNNRTLIIPADIHMVTKSKNDMNAITSASIHLADGTPVALTITNKNDMNDVADETYTVTYADADADADESELFDDNHHVYNISDTEMLVNTVESMQFLGESGTEIKPEHSEQFSLDDNDNDVNSVVLSNNNSSNNNNNNNNNTNTGILERLIKVKSNHTNSTTQTFLTSQAATDDCSSVKLAATAGQLNNNNNNNNSNNKTIQTVPLPNFQQFHSKEIVMQTSAQLQAFASPSRSNTLTLPSFTSPMHSPLQYPTPPSSHENVTQSSPFIEDRHNSYMDETTNHFFADKCNLSEFLSQAHQTTGYYKTTEHNVNELQNSLNDNDAAFDTPIKVEDLLSGSQDGVLPEFSETNLSFLDDDQLFLNDTPNDTSALSKNYFTGSVDDVKRMLRDVLAEENVIMNADQRSDNMVDLCYITGVGMMPNSDDPLLSSCSHEFGQQRVQDQPTLEQQQQTIEQSETNQELQPLVSKSLLQQQLQQKPQEKFLQHVEANNLPEKSLIYHQGIPTVLQENFKKINENVTENNSLQVNTNESQHISNKFTKQSCLSNAKPLQEYEIFNVKNQVVEIQEPNQITTSIASLTELGENVERNILAKNEINTHEPEVAVSTTTTTSISGESINWEHTNLLKNFPQFSIPPITCTVQPSLLQPVSNHTKSILKRHLTLHVNLNGNNKSYTYQSKLRKPSRTHYTPSPMLNPDRDGLGLYRNVRKKLNANSRSFDSFNSDDFSDHIGLAVFSDESKVNLGSDYQAQIPQLTKINNNVQNMINCEELMWDPNVQTDQVALERYLNLSKSAGVPLGSHSEEDALHTLLMTKGVTATAVLTLLQTRANQLNTKWSPNDLEVFFQSLENFGKDFSRISNKVGTKTSGDCVQMYYFWKRICVEKNKTGFIKNSNNINYNNTNTTDQLTMAMKQTDKLQSRQNYKNDLYLNNNNNIAYIDAQLTKNNQPNSDVPYVTINNNNNINSSSSNNNLINSNNNNQIVAEIKPFVCEVTDCSASFMSKAALHGHTRIHSTNSKNDSHNTTTTTTTTTTTAQHMNGQTASPNNSASKSNALPNTSAVHACAANMNSSKESCPIQYPCKMCGKVFSKVKSRSAHMKTHRSQELNATLFIQNSNVIHQARQQQQQPQQQTEIVRLLQQNNSSLATAFKSMEEQPSSQNKQEKTSDKSSQSNLQILPCEATV